MVGLKQKKGWIRVIEAIASVLVIAGILLVVLNQQTIIDTEPRQMEELQTSILRELQTTPNLRNAVLEQNFFSVDTIDPGEGSIITNVVDSRTPQRVQCETRICTLDSACEYSEEVEEDIYVETGFFSGSIQEGYSPRKVKLFCWSE